ncbi:hypothetical protein GCM10028798_00710 [Humibacter antri]
MKIPTKNDLPHPALSRRGFIGGAIAVPIMAGLGAEAASAAPSRPLGRWRQREFIISSFEGLWGDPKNFPTLAPMLLKLGLNTTELAFQSRDASLAALAVGDTTGLKILANEEADTSAQGNLFSNFSNIIVGVDTPAAVAQAIQIYSGHPSLLGYGVWDEPPASEIANAGKLMAAFRQQAPDKLALMGALPQYTWGPFGSTAEWTSYLDDYASTIDFQLMGIDYYPFPEIDKGMALEDTNYFLTLGYARRKALEKNVGIWSYIQSVGDVNTLALGTMTVDRIRLQVFTSLVYGARAISYFEVPGGLIDLNTLQETELYEGTAQINRTVASWGPLLIGLTSSGVYQTGKVNNPFDDDLNSQDLVADAPAGLIIGRFEGHGSNEYLMLVNRDYTSSANGALTLNGRFNISEVSGDGGMVRHTSQISFSLQPGQGRLYRIRHIGA